MGTEKTSQSESQRKIRKIRKLKIREN